MVIIAHRGGNRVFPENSIAAINHSFKIGADIVEIDVRLSKDSIPVIIHDDNLKRLFLVDKNVHDITADEFISLKYEHPIESHPATLEYTLANCQKSPLLLHVKEKKEKMLSIIEVVERHKSSLNFVWGITSLDNLNFIKQRRLDMPVLAFIPSIDDISRFINAGVDAIRLWDAWITEDKINMIHRHGIIVAAMTGNPAKDVGETTSERLSELKSLGIDWVLVNDVQLTATTLTHP